MKRKLALSVEWAWSQGNLKTKVDLQHFIHKFFVSELLDKHPKSNHGDLLQGLGHLTHDVERVLKALTYGGRQVQDIPEQRLDYLKSQLQ